MTGVLALTNEFIERVMNPAFGSQINDDYSMRLGELMADPRSESLLESEVERLTRVDDLSAHTWLWLLKQDVAKRRLSHQLLADLCLAFQAPAFRVLVIDCATSEHPRLEPGEVDVTGIPPAIDNVESGWLSGLVRRVVGHTDPHTHNGDGRDGSVEQPARDFRSAESLLLALLTIDRGQCLQAAWAMLHHEWEGQAHLLEFLRGRTATMDEEARLRWQRLMPADDQLG